MERLKQETLEEAAAFYGNISLPIPYGYVGSANDFINGAKWQQERMYSEEDLRNAYRWGTTVNHGTKEHFTELIEQFKKK